MQRFAWFVTAFLLVCVVLACAGGDVGTKPPPAAGTDEAIVKEAERLQKEAIARRNEVAARNQKKKARYELESKEFAIAKTKYDADLEASRAAYKKSLDAFNKERMEYDSLRHLNSANQDPAKAKAVYKAIIIEFPGTSGAKEAERLLAGGLVTIVEIPNEPTKPSPPTFSANPPIEPTKPEYEKEPSIPDVPTLDSLQAARREKLARKAEEEFEENGLVLLNKTLVGTVDQFSFRITGTVVNRRSSTLAYAQITFNVYDATGAQIDSAIANINGLESGGRWNFEAVSLNPRGKKYKVSGLTGF
jgi:hypothetical protein